MDSMVSWEYYSSLHTKVTADEFDTAEALAEKEVKQVIGPIKWAEINEDTFGFAELQDCICNVIDRMVDDKTRIDRIGLSSVSNDGYSESYGTPETIASISAEMRGSIKEWLSGTGLVGAY